MTFPVGHVVNTTNLDASSDVADNARVDLLDSVQTLNAVVASYGQPSGVATLDATGLIPTTQLGGAALLAALAPVDGTGSGLDADMLDGADATAFFLVDASRAITVDFTNAIAINVRRRTSTNNARVRWTTVQGLQNVGGTVAGYGLELRTQLANSAGIQADASGIATDWTDSTSASEDAALVFLHATAGTLVEGARLLGAKWQMPQQSTPSGAPPSGSWWAYFTSSGLTIKDSSGAQSVLGSGSAVDHNTLLNLTVGDAHTQYFRTDGSRVMGGDIQLGAHTIQFTDTADPAGLPPSGIVYCYSKAQGLFYKTHAGTIVGPLGTAGGGTGDHHALTNLTTFDDHTQYLLRQPTADVVINNSGGNFNFTIKGVSAATLFVVNANAATVGINTAESGVASLSVAATASMAGIHSSVTAGLAIFAQATTGVAVSASVTNVAGQAGLFKRTVGSAPSSAAVLLQEAGGSGFRLLDVDGIAATDLARFRVGSNEVLKLLAAEAVINDTGSVYDFRVEGDTLDHLLYANAANDVVNVNGVLTGARFNVQGGTLDAIYALTTTAAKYAVKAESQATSYAILATAGASAGAGSGINAFSVRDITARFTKDMQSFTALGAAAVIVEVLHSTDTAAALAISHANTSGGDVLIAYDGASATVIELPAAGGMVLKTRAGDMPTPAAGTFAFYPLSTGLFVRDSTGTIVGPLGVSGGAGLSGGTDKRIVRWNGTTAVQSSLWQISNLGEMTTTAPIAQTATSGTLIGLGVSQDLNPAGVSTAQNIGAQFTVTSSGAQNLTLASGGLVGLWASVLAQGTGTTTEIIGHLSVVSKVSSGAVTRAYGDYIQINNLNATNNIGTGVGVYIDAPITNGPIVLYYPIYVNGTTGTVSLGCSLQQRGSTSGNLTHVVPANVTTYSVTWPSAIGTGGFLFADGSGNLSWSSGSGGAALSSISAASGAHSIDSGANAQVWQWNLGATSNVGFIIQESVAATSTSCLMQVKALAGSTAKLLELSHADTVNGKVFGVTGGSSMEAIRYMSFGPGATYVGSDGTGSFDALMRWDGQITPSSSYTVARRFVSFLKDIQMTVPTTRPTNLAVNIVYEAMHGHLNGTTGGASYSSDTWYTLDATVEVGPNQPAMGNFICVGGEINFNFATSITGFHACFMASVNTWGSASQTLVAYALRGGGNQTPAQGGLSLTTAFIIPTNSIFMGLSLPTAQMGSFGSTVPLTSSFTSYYPMYIRGGAGCSRHGPRIALGSDATPSDNLVTAFGDPTAQTYTVSVAIHGKTSRDLADRPDDKYALGVYESVGNSFTGRFAAYRQGGLLLMPIAAPVEAKEGGIYCDTSLHKLWFYNGTSWLDLTQGGAGGGTPAISDLNPATMSHTVDNGINPQNWQWTLGASGNTGMLFSETAAGTSSVNKLVQIQTLNSTQTTALTVTKGTGGSAYGQVITSAGNGKALSISSSGAYSEDLILISQSSGSSTGTLIHLTGASTMTYMLIDDGALVRYAWLDAAWRQYGTSSGYIAFAAAATVTSHTLTWPAALPASAGYLKTTTGGTLSWDTTVVFGQSHVAADGAAGTVTIKKATGGAAANSAGWLKANRDDGTNIWIPYLTADPTT